MDSDNWFNMSQVDRDVQNLRLVAKRVPVYARIIKLFRDTWDEMGRRVAYWTAERERRFLKLMKMFERNWCAVHDFILDYGEFGVAPALWKQVETLAAMMFPLIHHHEAASKPRVW